MDPYVGMQFYINTPPEFLEPGQRSEWWGLVTAVYHLPTEGQLEALILSSDDGGVLHRWDMPEYALFPGDEGYKPWEGTVPVLETLGRAPGFWRIGFLSPGLTGAIVATKREVYYFFEDEDKNGGWGVGCGQFDTGAAGLAMNCIAHLGLWEEDAEELGKALQAELSGGELVEVGLHLQKEIAS